MSSQTLHDQDCTAPGCQHLAAQDVEEQLNPLPTTDRLYQKLDEQQIRLLQLLPGRTEQLYEAVSYSGSGPHGAIQVNETQFSISANLRDALLQLRSSSHSRYIWADQICVNQNNTYEKDVQQIPLMHRIYEEASRVLIWLGRGDNDCIRGMRLLQRLGSILTSSTESSPPKLKDHEAMAINRLLTLRWFRRVWVLQEVAAAKTALVMYGLDSLEWRWFEHFDKMCQEDAEGAWTKALLSTSVATDSTTQQILESRFITAHIHLISSMKAPLHQPNASLSDALLLTQVRTSQATLPKDKILSLLGFLSQPLRDHLREIDNGIDLPTSAFYRSVATFETSRNDMSFLEAAGLRQRSCIALPSWVPDWTVVLCHHEFWYLNRVSGSMPLYTASGGEPAYAEIDPACDKVLHVRARIVDTISEAGQPFNWTIRRDHADHAEESKLKSIKDIIRLCSERHRGIQRCLDSAATCTAQYGESWQSAWQQTMVAGLMQIGEGSTQGGTYRRANDAELQPLYATYFQAMQILANNDALASCEREEEGRADTSDKVHLQRIYVALFLLPQVQKLIQHIQDACKRRIFFTTSKGFMGLGPQALDTAREGDQICVIHGCSVPMIIRRCESQDEQSYYELVGEAYVHGLMDGEVMRLDDVVEQELVLK